MQTKKPSGASEWVDPDDAPELTDAFFDKAEVFHGDRFLRRRPGRPRAAAAKEQISVRLDPDVLVKLRQAGPGWQSQINALLRQALGIGEQTRTPNAGAAIAKREPIDAARLEDVIRELCAALAADPRPTVPVKDRPGTKEKPARSASADAVPRPRSASRSRRGKHVSP